MELTSIKSKNIGNNPNQTRIDGVLEDSLDVIRLINVGEFSKAEELASKLKSEMSFSESKALKAEISAFLNCFSGGETKLR